MIHSRRNQRRLKSRAGFTLIEVLIAAFVISLGVLGLLALFAGAASQQQGASQITQSVFFSNSAASIVSNGLGRLDFSKAPPPPEGLWTPVHMDDQDYFLTLTSNSGPCNDSPFFLLEAAKTELFSAPVPGFPDEHGFVTFGSPPLKTRLINASPFISWAPFRLPGRDFVPDSIEIKVTVTGVPPNQTKTRTFTFSRPADTDLSTVYNNNDIDDDDEIFVFPLDGVPTIGLLPPVPNPNYISINVRPCFPPNNLDAELVRVVFDAVPGSRFDLVSNNPVGALEYISKIEFVRGKRRSRDLVSLADRTRYRADENAPDGRRPEMTYSLLKRQKGPLLQAMIVTYQLIAPSGSARWRPPETENEYPPDKPDDPWRDSPLRRVDLELGYDLALQQYFVERTGTDDDDLWAIAPGQILIAQRDLSDSTVPSADAPVRIIRQQRILVDGTPRIRGMLDRGPRHDGSSYLPTAKRLTEDTHNIRFIGVNDIVRSLDDGSDWRLAPIDARVIQVVN